MIKHSLDMTNITKFFKLLFILPVMALPACSTNEATGRNQFTGLMPASQEASIGAQEHERVLAEFGGEVKNPTLKNYVTSVGRKIVPYTERQDVNYTFTVLDSPVVNAFALPGGYVYVTRGILALANNEAELAAVMAHEIGHVTARHSAERYSTSVLTGLGASVLAAAINVNGASQALGLGANLYLSSYSRSQEHESDDLGIRYISRAGYDPMARSSFLRSLEASTALEAKELGVENSGGNSYFSTHPVTAERVARSASTAQQYPAGQNATNHIEYLRAINGMEIADSASQGFVSNGKFVHPELGFSFDIPQGFRTQNSPSAFVAQASSGATLMFSGGAKTKGQTIGDFLQRNILKGDMNGARDFGTNRINGMNTASVEKPATVNGKSGNVRLVAFEWDADTAYVFTLAMPAGTSSADVQAMQQSVFSFQKIGSGQASAFRPKTLSLRVAKPGDTVESMAASFPYNDRLNAERFRVFNGMRAGEQVIANQAYKVITQ